jgi:ribonucleoside-diphosphate reductase alpha chain
MGFQDLLFRAGLRFDSDEAVALSDELQEYVSYYAILGSSELAKERGTYESYKGSKWDRGIFPLDTIALLEEERGLSTGINRTARMDWAPVREHVAKYGMRNSNVMAIAPTATIANISGSLPSIEPIYKNLYVKSNFSGEFTIINRYLVEDLKKLNLWNQDIIDKLKHYEGSVQRIYEIPPEVRAKYQEVFEIDTHWIVKHAAYRAKWIDQSQSVNIFTTAESGKYISGVYIDAWQSGLKTTYYLRTLAATSIEKSTLDINKNYESPEEPAAEGGEDAAGGAEASDEQDAEVTAEARAGAKVAVAVGAVSMMGATAGGERAVEAELASANTLAENLKEALRSAGEKADKPIVSASKVIHIAEDGLCESCQ